jgi:GT2 family glycosyltransferase
MLTIIIVNWNVRDLLRACLQSLERHPASRHSQRIIVVDNASTDGSVAMLREEFPAVQVVASARNAGYGGGNNLGLARAEQLDAAAGRPTSSHFLILNPDTEATPGALDALLDYADAHADAGIVGPQLRYADGSAQSSRRRFPTLATALFESTWLQPLAPRRLLDDYYVRDRRDDETCDVDWVVGAAMLVRREAYLQVGGFDEQSFFMYSEEIDWCRRIKQAGWRVIYHPQSVIIHHEGKSSEQVSARRMIHFNTSKVRYFAKHHGRAQAGILRLALLSLFAEQSLVEGAKWLVGHRRPLRAERLAAYRAVLQSGLR